MSTTTKFICVKSHNGSKPSSCWWAELDDNGWVDGETPIEDYGMFMILDKEIEPKSADRIFLALLGNQENDIPEIVGDDYDFTKRSIHAPNALTQSEFDVYLSLITK